MNIVLTQLVQKFQNMPPIQIDAIMEGGDIHGWFTVNPSDIIPSLVISQDTMAEAAGTAAEILYWGRLVAHCQRVWEIRQRNLRTWKAERYLSEVDLAESKKEKKPSDKLIEAKYRVHPEYNNINHLTEKAGESFSGVQCILDAFKAKRDLLRFRSSV